jgi:uncharacterized RDD family membrane protein YckC
MTNSGCLFSGDESTAECHSFLIFGSEFNLRCNFKEMETLGSEALVPGMNAEMLSLEARYDEIIFPSLVTRIKAVFIDVLIMLLIFTGSALLIDVIGDVPDFVKGFILIFMVYMYDPVLTSFTGSTLGHKIMKLKVRKYHDPDAKISLGYAFLRFLTKGTLGWISFLTVTANKRKRAIHDMVSGSILLPVR